MSAPRALPAALLVVLSLLVLPLAGAGPAAAAKAKPAKCKTGQAAIKVGRTRTCVVPAKAAATLRAAATAELQRSFAKLPRRQRRVLNAKAVARIRAAAEKRQRQELAKAAAASASGCAGAPTASATSAPKPVEGFDATSVASRWDGDATGTSTGLETGGDAVKGGLSYRKREKQCIRWDPCPDADGILHGRYEWSQVETFVAKVDGTETRRAVSLSATAELTAHVGDDARVKTYDYVLDGVMEATGSERPKAGRLEHEPTRVFRVHVTRNGLDPHQSNDTDWTGDTVAARGPKGTNIPQEVVKGLSSLTVYADLKIETDGAAILLASERHFNDDAACLPVTMTPGSAKVQPGERVPVEVTIKDLAGTELSLPFQVTTHAGTADVGSATSKATVGWTAPQDRAERLMVAMHVRHVSKRGVAEDWFEPAWADKPPRFAAELSFSSKYTWEYAHSLESNVGTDSECVSQTKGDGYHWLFLDSVPDKGGTVQLVEGVPVFLLEPLIGTYTDDGTLTTTQVGPASSCQPPSSSAPRDGCGTEWVKDVSPSIGWQGDGTITLELSGYRTPGSGGSCPIRTPDYGTPLSDELDLVSTGQVSLADLKDPNKKTIEIKGVLQKKGHEDCLSEDNGGCGDDPHTSRIRYSIDGWLDLDWTLTLKRLDS